MAKKERQAYIIEIEMMLRQMNVVVYDKRTDLETLDGLIGVLRELPWSDQSELPFPEEVTQADQEAG